MKAYAEETNRLNRERRALGASDRRELADIEDGGYVRGMMDRLRELEARQDELTERLSAVPAEIPDIHPNIADIYRHKVARLAEALNHPEDRGASSAIRGLTKGILLAPGEAWRQTDITLRGDLGAILEWTGAGNDKTGAPQRRMSVSVVAGAGSEPATFRL